jgi:hypothetical protein
LKCKVEAEPSKRLRLGREFVKATLNSSIPK